MTTLEQLTYDIYSSIAGESRISDDLNLDVELIQFKLINRRSFLIRQDQEKGRSLSDNVTQTLSCVEVIQVDQSECPCEVPSNCTILRTRNKLPKFIELYQKDLVTKVSMGISSRGWSIISFARASVSGTSSWTNKNTKVFLHSGYIYILNAPLGIKTVSISGVFEDPREASTFANCDGTPCYSDDDAFPISAHMVPTLKELVLKDLGPLVQMPIDDKGDEEYNKPNVLPKGQ